MSLRHLYLLVATLEVIGVSTFSYKVTRLGFPVLPDTSSQLWTVEARIEFMRYTPGPAKVALEVPTHPVGFGVLNEHFVSRGYGVSIREEDNRREALWAIRRVQGDQAVYYRLSLFRDQDAKPPRGADAFPPVPALEEPYASALAMVISEVREESADVATFTGTLLRRVRNATADDDVALLLEDADTPIQRAEVARMLLAGARIPARVLQALPLTSDTRQVAMMPWLAVHNGTQWLYFDPASGEQSLPRDLFIWSWDSARVMSVSGGTGERIEFWVTRQLENALSVAKRRATSHGSRIVDFSLLDLPLQTQSVYSILIMIPIGALLVVLMRNIVGVRTFGTFLPVLVALAFRESQLISGIILFSLLVAVGLGVRFYLERLHLLLVPRLAAVLIVVVLMMAAVSVLSYRLGLEIGLSVALFPMGILTMVIERMSVVWEERGPGDAIKEGLGSLLVAALVYGVMNIDLIRHITFVFPEVLLIVLGVVLLLGRYTGYRLTDLGRFRVLTKNTPAAGAD